MSKDQVLYVASMLASSVQYNKYVPAVDGGVPQIAGSVIIKGGAGLADKNFLTPEGAVITAITAEDYELMKNDPVYKLHEAKGYVKVHTDKVDPEVAAAFMQGRDVSSPLVTADFEAEGARAPIVNKDVGPDGEAKTATSAAKKR